MMAGHWHEGADQTAGRYAICMFLLCGMKGSNGKFTLILYNSKYIIPSPTLTMQAFNFFYTHYSPFGANTPQVKEEFATPPQGFISLDHFEKTELLSKIQYLQMRCQLLEDENLRLRSLNEQQGLPVVKIESDDRNFNREPEPCLEDQTSSKQKKSQKAPKKRRSECELTKNFKCPYEDCRKFYASVLALNLHIRVKHNGGTKKQRKQLLKQIINAELKGTSMPEINLNLPPNYLEEKKKLLLCCEDYEQISNQPVLH